MDRKNFLSLLGLGFLTSCFEDGMNVRRLLPYLISELSIKKDFLLLGAGGQSPLGTIDQFGQEDYGKQPYSVKPIYLKDTLSNVVRSVKITGGQLGVEDWEDRNGVVWGYYDKVVYMLSQFWTQGMACFKESLGGSTNDTAANGGGTFPMSVFMARLNQMKTYADTNYGAGNYNKLIFWDIGHTNCLDPTLAGRLGSADIEKFAEIRAVLGDDTVIMVVWTPTTVNVDFPYVVSIGQPQQTLAAADNVNNFVVKGINARWSDQDIANTPPGSLGDDFSHQDVPGDLSKANDCIDVVCQVYSLTRPGSVPQIVSAVIDSASPRDIVITTDSTTIDTDQSPQYFDFSVKVNGALDRRIATTITMSSTGFTVRFSQSFYIGQTVQLTYNKKHVFEACVCDINGNEIEAFTDLSVTNNSATAVPTVMNLYTMDLSGGVNGWGNVSGASVSVVGDYLRMTATATSAAIFRSVTMNTGTFLFQATVKINGDLLVGGSKSNDYSLNMNFGTIGVAGALYPYFRRDALTGDLQFQFVFTNPNANQIRFAITPIDIGEFVEVKEVTLDRLS